MDPTRHSTITSRDPERRASTNRSAPPSRLLAAALAVVIALAWGPPARGQRGVLDTPNPSGVLRTITLDGSGLDLTNPFFQSLGTNGRSCVSCHVPSTGWTISPPEVQRRFELTRGLDPIFRTVDGSNSPQADVSTIHARRQAYSMLLNKGVAVGPNGRERVLSRASVELMMSDQLTPAQKEGAEIFFGDGAASWGMGGAVVTRRTHLFATPGRYGWDGGYGTSAHADPAEDLVGVLLTQRMMDSPVSPRVFTEYT